MAHVRNVACAVIVASAGWQEDNTPRRLLSRAVDDPPALASTMRVAQRTTSCFFRTALLFALLLPARASFAGIWLASIDGACLDEHGKPMAGAVLRFTDATNGRHFQLITGADGKFFYIAAPPAIYNLEIARNHKPPVVFEKVDIQWSSRPLQVEINLERNAVKVTRSTMLPEFFRQDESQAALLAQGTGDQAAVAAINHQLTLARQLSEQHDWQGAISALWNAIEIDPNRDLPWALLASAQCSAAEHSADGSAALLDDCVRSYQKAIAITSAAAYHNNLGNALVKLKRYGDAVEQYRAAQLLNPDHSALYQQNIGLALVEQAQSRPNDSALELLQRASQAFSRVPEVNAGNAEVSYWKGICQLRLAANEMGSYQEAAAAFQNYLQLAPRGRFAAEVAAMLHAMEQGN